MGKMNKFIIVLASVLVLVAVSGTASASLAYSIDHIWANGYYSGNPVILSGDPARYGYEYIFHPDGTYTIFGTLTNDGAASDEVYIDFYSKAHWSTWGWDREIYTVPAKAGGKNGKVDFELTTKADSVDDLAIWLWNENPRDFDHNVLDLTGIDFENRPDTTSHTIDQGPMSNAVAIYSNGKLTYNGLPQYWAYI